MLEACAQRDCLASMASYLTSSHWIIAVSNELGSAKVTADRFGSAVASRGCAAGAWSSVCEGVRACAYGKQLHLLPSTHYEHVGQRAVEALAALLSPALARRGGLAPPTSHPCSPPLQRSQCGMCLL